MESFVRLVQTLWVSCLTPVEECCMMIWRIGINSSLSSNLSSGLAHHSSNRFSLSITLPSSLNNNSSSKHADQVSCLFLPLSSKYMP